MLYPDSRTMFWKPTGELMNNSYDGYMELISERFLHISCLSVSFVWLLCPSAVVTPSGNGRIASLPLGSSSAAICEQPHGKGIAVPCPAFPQSWFASRLKFSHVKLKLASYMTANWYKIQAPCNKQCWTFCSGELDFSSGEQLEKFPFVLKWICLHQLWSTLFSSGAQALSQALAMFWLWCGSHQSWEDSLIPSAGR